jgi:hypothetical protein
MKTGTGFGPWTTRTVDNSNLKINNPARGPLGPWITRPVDYSALGQLGPHIDTSDRGQLGLLDSSARGLLDPYLYN